MKGWLRHLPLPAALVLALVALWICIRIDTMNERAGNVLPRTEPGKWRISRADEASWRRLHLPIEEDGSMPLRPLTAAERDQMLADLQSHKIRNTLRGIVASIGILQYPLLIVLTVLITAGAAVATTSIWRWSYLVPGTIAAFCGYRMFALSYFSSLGW